MADVTLTVDGKKITAPAGTLLIEACKSVGIEVPSFCYYPGLSLQGACRMCLVKIEKMPKLQTACTTAVTEGMVVATDSDEVRRRARRWSSCCSATIRWIARCATPAASANCRTWRSPTAPPNRNTSRPRTTRKNNSGRRLCISTARVAFCVTAACASAAKAWMFGRSACRTAA